MGDKYQPTQADLDKTIDKLGRGIEDLDRLRNAPDHTGTGWTPEKNDKYRAEKAEAYEAAVQYRAELQDYRDGLGPVDRVDADRFAQAEHVAHAAVNGGWLTDSRWYPERKVAEADRREQNGEPDDPWSRSEVEDYRNGNHHTQVEHREKVASGYMVAEPRVEGEHVAHHRLTPPKPTGDEGEESPEPKVDPVGEKARRNRHVDSGAAWIEESVRANDAAEDLERRANQTENPQLKDELLAAADAERARAQECQDYAEAELDEAERIDNAAADREAAEFQDKDDSELTGQEWAQTAQGIQDDASMVEDMASTTTDPEEKARLVEEAASLQQAEQHAWDRASTKLAEEQQAAENAEDAGNSDGAALPNPLNDDGSTMTDAEVAELHKTGDWAKEAEQDQADSVKRELDETIASDFWAGRSQEHREEAQDLRDQAAGTEDSDERAELERSAVDADIRAEATDRNAATYDRPSQQDEVQDKVDQMRGESRAWPPTDREPTQQELDDGVATKNEDGSVQWSPTNDDFDWTDEQEMRAAGHPAAQDADYSEEPLEDDATTSYDDEAWTSTPENWGARQAETSGQDKLVETAPGVYVHPAFVDSTDWGADGGWSYPVARSQADEQSQAGTDFYSAGTASATGSADEYTAY